MRMVAYLSITTVAAADEVHDLKMISIRKLRLGPVISGDDFAIEFHRNPIGLESQICYERCKREWPPIALLFAIDV
jgi:hypothetical protein